MLRCAISCATSAALLLIAVAAHSAETPFEQQCAKLAEQSGDDPRRLSELFALEWDYSMHDHPESATEVGYPGQNDRWTDQSLEAIERRKRELHAPLKVIQSINRADLSPPDQLNYDLFKKNHEDAIEGSRFKGDYMPITQMNGVPQEIAQILEISPRATVGDYENILARLKKVPTVIDQTIVLLKKGLETGVTPPRITLRDVPQQIKSQLESNPDKNPMLKPFYEFPVEIQESDRTRLRNEATKTLKADVIPAFTRLHDFFVKTYLPGTRETIG